MGSRMARNLMKAGFHLTVHNRSRQIVDDLVKGLISFENSALDDYIIIKSDGVPTYNFAAVIDDALMEMTHIIRGDDHLSNTPRQIQVYQALGFALPKFAHIPMILGPDKTRLSKRHGATSVTQYRDNGYLPESMLNYLALLGWSLNATETLFTKEQLVKYFTLERCSKNPAVFDTKKLEWMNGVYIRKAEVARIAEMAVPYLQAAGLVSENPTARELELVNQVVALQQTRLKTVNEIVETSEYFFRRPTSYEEAALANLAVPHAVKALETLRGKLSDSSLAWETPALEEAFKSVWEELGLSTGELIHPVRSALTGKKVSPGIYDVLLVLGREESLARLGAGVVAAKEAAQTA
jgi:glutamyl-tRNA synthetase